MVQDANPYLVALDAALGGEQLRDPQLGAVPVDVAVVGQDVDEGGLLARLGLGHVVHGNRGVLVARRGHHRHRCPGRVEEAVGDAVGQVLDTLARLLDRRREVRVPRVDPPPGELVPVVELLVLELDGVAARDQVVLRDVDGHPLARGGADLVLDGHGWLGVAGLDDADPDEAGARGPERLTV